MSTELDKLIAESEAAIKRLDELQQRKPSTPFLQRIGRHLHKNSPYLINVLLAGSVFAVALGRLIQKQEHQADREAWEREQRRMQSNMESADQRAAAVLSSTEALIQRLEQAAEGRGARDLPAFLRQQVSDWRQQTAAHAEQLAASPAAGDAKGSSSSSGSPRVMI